MTKTRKRFSLALVAVLAGVASGCADREEKVVVQGDAEEIARDSAVLDQLRAAGSNLAKPHRIAFYLYLPSKPEADAAEAEVRSMGYRVEVLKGPDDIHWLCLATRTMVPTIQGLTDARVVFKGLAQRHKGAYDGWQAAIER